MRLLHIYILMLYQHHGARQNRFLSSSLAYLPVFFLFFFLVAPLVVKVAPNPPAFELRFESDGCDDDEDDDDDNNGNVLASCISCSTCRRASVFVIVVINSGNSKVS